MTKTPAPTLPIDLAIVRQQVKLDTADNDALLRVYLDAAVDWAQNYTGKQFVAAELQLQLEAFPDEPIRLLRGPVVGIAAINYYDADGVQQTLSANSYSLESSSHIALIHVAPNASWPETQTRPDAVTVTYYAGYVAHAAFNVAANSVTLSNWPALAVNAPLRFSNSGGALPAALAERVTYYVKTVVSPGVYTLSAIAGGAEIDIVDIGSGLQFAGQPGAHFGGAALPGVIIVWLLLRVASLDEHRAEHAIVANGKLEPLPYADRLLDSVRLMYL